MSEFDDDRDDKPKDAHLTPEVRAGEKVAELRMHSELAAVYEGLRKFDASLVNLDGDLAREVQRAMAKFEKSKVENTPILAEPAMPDAERILTLCEKFSLSTNDYHVYRRPGEVMIVRWLAGDEVETFYSRYQAHCDAALEGLREDEQSALSWKADDKTKVYLELLENAKLDAQAMYLRKPMREHSFYALSTTAADEMNIRFLCEHLMGAEVEALVGEASTPGDGAAEQDLAWFFKLFGVRGVIDDVERMCFFTYLQKADDSFDF